MDIAAVGQAADIVTVTALPGPAFYPAEGDMADFLTWLTGQVEPRKLQLLVPVALTSEWVNPLMG